MAAELVIKIPESKLTDGDVLELGRKANEEIILFCPRPDRFPPFFVELEPLLDSLLPRLPCRLRNLLQDLAHSLYREVVLLAEKLLHPLHLYRPPL